ncbi:MAG: ATP-binding protein [Pseudomonadota bacterium]
MDSQQVAVRSDLAELERLCSIGTACGRQAGLSDDDMLALELSLEEAVANIMMHGHVPQDGEHILVTFSPQVQTLVVKIEDDGPPFDPTTLPAHEAPASIDDASIGGLGIKLIRKLSAGMDYQRVGERNQLTLVFGAPPLAA